VGLPVGSRASLSGADAAAPSLTPDLVGVYSVSLRVTDAAGNVSRTATARVNVTGDCRASPTATINAPSGVAVGVPTPLSATISDPNAPGPTTACTVATTPFAYAWSLIALPANSRATLFNAASASPTLTPDVAGTYTVALVATDAAGNRSLTATRNVVVSDSCAAPLTVSVSAPVGARTRVPVQLSATARVWPRWRRRASTTDARESASEPKQASRVRWRS
jgi:PKD repeat protein